MVDDYEDRTVAQKCHFSNIGAFFSRISGNFRFLYRPAQLISLISADQNKEDRKSRKNTVEPSEQDVQAVLTLFVVAIFSGVVGFCLELRGWNDLGCGRRSLGRLWIGLGVGVCSFGLFSLAFGGWPWTWNWAWLWTWWCSAQA